MSYQSVCGACRHKRPRTEVDPEAVLLKSGLDASTAAAFLQESMLEFADAEGMDEAAEACSYLSHAGNRSFCKYSPGANKDQSPVAWWQCMPCV